MKHDDRFSMIAGGAAFLATATVFALTHLGGAGSVGETPAPDRFGERITVAEAPRLEPAVAPVPTEESVAPVPELVAAVNRPAPEPADEAGKLSPAALSGPSLGVGEVLRLLALSGPEVPETAKVLVRRDRDGRMVVASGTHRGYASVVDRFEALDASRVHVPEALRGDVVRSIDRLLATPEVEIEPEMASNGLAWTFAGPELASLDRAQRQLLLMGRGNAGIVRSKLEELRRQLAPNVLRAVTTGDPAELDGPMILATAR